MGIYAVARVSRIIRAYSAARGLCYRLTLKNPRFGLAVNHRDRQVLASRGSSFKFIRYRWPSYFKDLN